MTTEFRHGGGNVSGSSAGLDLLLLHHVGAHSGIERVSPLLYWRMTDDSVAVLASDGGDERNPGWYYNLLAHPTASVELGDSTWDVQARTASAAERRAALDRMMTTRSVREEVERSSREMPVVILQLLGAGDQNAANDRTA